jgi:hypothetical protein
VHGAKHSGKFAGKSGVPRTRSFFGVSHCVAGGERLREEYEREARARQGTRTDLNFRANLPVSETGRWRDAAAKDFAGRDHAGGLRGQFLFEGQTW